MELLFDSDSKMCEQCNCSYPKNHQAWTYINTGYPDYKPYDFKICVSCHIYQTTKQGLIQTLKMDPITKHFEFNYDKIVTSEFVYLKLILKAIGNYIGVKFVKSITWISCRGDDSLLYKNLNLIMEKLPMPSNNKSIFATLCKTLQMLVNGEIKPEQANSIAKIASQTNNSLTYELKRAALMTNEDFREKHRNIEIKEFDQLPENT